MKPGGGGDPELAARAAELRERREALAYDQRALARERETRRRTYGWRGVLNGLAVFAACGLGAVVPLYLQSVGVLDRGTASWLMPTLMLSAFALGLFLVIRWQSAPERARDSAPAPEPAPIFGREDPALASPAAIEDAIHHLDREQRRTKLARLAEDRLSYTQMPSGLRHLDLIIGGSLLVPLTLASVIFSAGMISSTEKYDPAVWLLWGLVAGGAAALVGWRRLRARRKQALDAALDRLAGLVGGQRLAGFHAAIDWMNRIWAAPSTDLYHGTLDGALAATCRGYPVLVDIDLKGLSGEDTTIEPRVLVYVAALTAPDPPAGPELARLEASLDRAGFEVLHRPDAGLVARANIATVRRLRRRVAELAALGPVINDLVRMAEVSRAPPATVC